MPERQSLRILLACSRPLVLKAQRWVATLGEEARPHLEAAKARLKEVADPGDIEARGRILIFHLYPPAPGQKLLREALRTLIPLKKLSGEPAPVPMDIVRPGEEVEAVRRGLEGMSREIQVAVHGAATLPEINRELMNAEPGFDVLHFVGHGGESGALYFEDGSGGARRVMPDELTRLVRGRVKLLVTMGCFSERAVGLLSSPLTKGELKGVVSSPAVVCIDGQHPIEARAAEIFSGALYSGLAQGRTLKRSFDDALEAARMDDEVGERAMPGTKKEPAPWRRFVLKGDSKISFSGLPAGSARIQEIIKLSPHTKIARTDELFVGRNADIAAIAELLEPPRLGIREHKPRIITLCGEGGIGKTRLAQAAADWLAERGKFPGGIFEAACDGLTDARALALAILKAMGVAEAEKLPEPADALVELLKGLAERTLLALDNLDDLFAPEADSGEAGRLLKNCLTASSTSPLTKISPTSPLAKAPPISPLTKPPSESPLIKGGRGVVLLATCRWPLELGSDEHAFTVEPMIPRDAVELFILCIPDTEIQAELDGMREARQAEMLGRLLNLTAGMPLCIILAARRLRRHSESLETLLKKAADDLMETMEAPELKHLPERLRSLRASLDLSYNHLSEAAREVFARMSFFPGGLSRRLDLWELLGEGWTEAAEEVARYALARYDRSAERYSMLHPVMEYARGKLDELGGDDFRRRATGFWADFARWNDLMMDVRPAAQERAAELLKLPDEPEERRQAQELLRDNSFAALAAEEDNLVRAAEWALGAEDEAGLGIVDSLDDYLELRRRWYTEERLYRLALPRQRALAESDPQEYLPDVAMTLNNMGNLQMSMGHPDEALAHYKEASEIYREFFKRYPSAYARNFLITLRGAMAVYEKLRMKKEAEECRREMEEIVDAGY